MDKNSKLIENNIYYLHNVLSVNECNQYIKASEQFGYDESSQISKLGEEFKNQSLNNDIKMIWPPSNRLRKNKRLIWQIPSNEAQRIYNLIKNAIPKSLQIFYDEINDKKWQMIGLNARFRFFKYNKNDEFKPHIDAASASLKNNIYHRSFISVVIYLTDNYEDGETQFYDENGIDKTITIKPKQGSVLLFYHDGSGKKLSKRHCGAQLKNGTKYIIRSDLMFVE